MDLYDYFCKQYSILSYWATPLAHISKPHPSGKCITVRPFMCNIIRYSVRQSSCWKSAKKHTSMIMNHESYQLLKTNLPCHDLWPVATKTQQYRQYKINSVLASLKQAVPLRCRKDGTAINSGRTVERTKFVVLHILQLDTGEWSGRDDGARQRTAGPPLRTSDLQQPDLHRHCRNLRRQRTGGTPRPVPRLRASILT